MRAAIYPRLSKDRSGISENVEVQIAECEAYAEEHGWSVVGCFPDNDLSASKYSTKPRPGYQALLAAVCANQVDVVLVTEMERLYRRMDELTHLIKLAESTSLRKIEKTDGNGYDLSTGEGIHNAISAVNNAQLESRKISDRSRRKKGAQARAGYFSGGRRPFGYDYIPAVRDSQGSVIAPGRLDPNRQEAAALRYAALRILTGATTRAVARDLNERQIFTTMGNLWRPYTLKRTLLAKYVLGIREHRYTDPATTEHISREYQATWPAILQRQTWEQLQVILNDESRFAGSKKRGRSYLLTGFVYCGECDRPLLGSGNVNHRKVYERAYACRKVGDGGELRGCGKVRRLADPVEELIRLAIITALDSPETAKALREQRGNAEFATLLAEYNQLKEQLRRIAGYLRRGTFDEVTYLEEKAQIEDDMERVRKGLELHSSGRVFASIPPGESIAKAWSEAESAEDLDWRRLLVSLLIQKIIIHRGHPGTRPWSTEKGTWNFDPSKVEIVWKG
jgi:site-specific DNA recombinase